MVALDQADALDLGAHLERDRRAFDFEVLDQDHRIAIREHGAIGVPDDRFDIFIRAGRGCGDVG